MLQDVCCVRATDLKVEKNVNQKKNCCCKQMCWCAQMFLQNFNKGRTTTTTKTEYSNTCSFIQEVEGKNG